MRSRRGAVEETIALSDVVRGDAVMSYASGTLLYHKL